MKTPSMDVAVEFHTFTKHLVQISTEGEVTQLKYKSKIPLLQFLTGI
jgi:hypothetical protein